MATWDISKEENALFHTYFFWSRMELSSFKCGYDAHPSTGSHLFINPSRRSFTNAFIHPQNSFINLIIYPSRAESRCCALSRTAASREERWVRGRYRNLPCKAASPPPPLCNSNSNCQLQFFDRPRSPPTGSCVHTHEIVAATSGWVILVLTRPNKRWHYCLLLN